MEAPQLRTPRSHEIWLVLGGQAKVEGPKGALSLAKGEVLFCSADAGPLTVQGQGDLWIASVPPSSADDRSYQ